MTDSKHPAYCRKEREIGEIHTDLKTIKTIVMGNGKEGLNVSVPILSQNVEKLDGSVGDLKTTLSGFVKFQENQEGQHEGRVEARRRSRWIIGTLITVLTALTGSVFYLIKVLLNHLEI